jgi:uncharacterized membrane-anchored protein YhcB (DUF1043 family)
VKQELKKSEALREKLQTLCRELQKQNKHVADESKRLAAEEQEKRQQQSEKFGATVKVGTADEPMYIGVDPRYVDPPS